MGRIASFLSRERVVELAAAGRLSAPIGWAALVLVVLYLVFFGSLFQMYIAGLVIIYAISALGLDWIQGRAGQVSIGSAAFMAIGAYVTATTANAGWPVVLSLVASGLAGALVGFVVGLPALRLRGLYLALSTLALQFITASSAVEYEIVAKKSAGFFVPPATLGPISLQFGPSYLIALTVALALVVIALQNMYRRAPGRAWLAIKESQMAAAVIGLNPTRWKLSAFVGSSALISISGSLLAYYTVHVSAETFSLNYAVSFVAMVIIGGLGSITGVILGALLVTSSPYVLSGLTAQLPPSLPIATWLNNNVFFINIGLYGVLVLVFLLYQPRGIAGAIDALGRWLLARAGGTARREVSPPALTIAPAAVNGHGRAEDKAMLDVRRLRVVYRTGACAVDGIDIHVNAGEVVALLGRNGAGKTSTLRAISGFFGSDGVRITGEVLVGGRDLRGHSPIATSRRGVILVPERDKIFPNLTVAEHLRLLRADPAQVDEIRSMFPVLDQRSASVAGLLSGGERQMLALAVAWCMRPKLLLIDELSLGLAPSIVKRLLAAVRDLQQRTGVPILLIEQNVSAALDVADRAYVLEAGRVVNAGTSRELSREKVAASALSER